MALNDYISVTISATGPGPSAPGFGTGLILAAHTVGGAARVLGPYTSLAGVAADFGNVSIGGTTNYDELPPYLMAQIYFEQTPSPSLLYVGRRANLVTQVVEFQPLSSVTGTVYKFLVGSTAGLGGTVITYTVPGSSSVASVCAAIKALFNAGIDTTYNVVTTDTSSTVLMTSSVPGQLVEVQVQVPADICYVSDNSTDPGIAADLTAVWAANKNWYGLLVDSQGAAETRAAAAWVESNGSVIFAATTSDSAAADSTSSSDVLSELKSDSYTRTAGLFTQYSNMSFGGVGWMAVHLTQPPGSDTWNFNTIAGVQPDSDFLCPESCVLAVQAKNGTVYTTLANLNLTQGGTMASGEWADQTRFVDWLRVTIQLAMVALLARNQGKVPYDDFGIAQIATILNGVLQQGVEAGGFVDGSIVITRPLVANIPVSSVSARTLPSLPWTATLAGAIHKIGIQGVTSVA
jgi:hypothetical protein